MGVALVFKPNSLRNLPFSVSRVALVNRGVAFGCARATIDKQKHFTVPLESDWMLVEEKPFKERTYLFYH